MQGRSIRMYIYHESVYVVCKEDIYYKELYTDELADSVICDIILSAHLKTCLIFPFLLFTSIYVSFGI